MLHLFKNKTNKFSFLNFIYNEKRILSAIPKEKIGHTHKNI